jgi:hypothetical protein
LTPEPLSSASTRPPDRTAARVDEEIAAGKLRRFDDLESFIADLTAE